MDLMISDANVLIDMDAGGLLPDMFRPPMQVGTPDLLFHEEIKPIWPGLETLGLRVMPVRAAYVQYALAWPLRHPLTRKKRKGALPGFLDCLALALAMQESCTLLTGDAHLRHLAEREHVPVKGTIGLLGLMVDQGLLGARQALKALDQMQAQQRWLPWAKARQMLQSRS
ncbi:MAG: hypothetical protein RIQ38_280 [Pseudomonadota bacterium]